ncbi:hypothetical protein [Bacillus cereus group sp. TH152-1LC]|uniref:hypothetical protein n=1 Tax=Bacillus cereus group sp. TH152-1LC TaxID=3018060 RepID=UPI0022DEF708|nr:hypothetical protein [Bacillus cereus group sp. TH152-1LC]MDA1675582.1 hypothetical protein [Bacillus cereus group sp. TH152-1LC]
MKKIFLLLFILMTMLLGACSFSVKNTWVLEKDRIAEASDVESYAKRLQNDKVDFRGYKVLTISEGKKMIVVSTGSTDKTLELTKADVSDNNTTILVKEKNKKSDEKNPFILIGINEIKGKLKVVNQSGDEFKSDE